MRTLVLLVLAFGLCTALVTNPYSQDKVKQAQKVKANPGPHALPICERLIEKRSPYPCEEFQVETEDGWFLNLIHVPPKVKGSPVVYLQHGLLGSAAAWFDQNSTESLGYILHKNGFDVWAGNSRGNWYSLTHKNLNIHDHAFWDSVDFDMMAQYDLPAFINFIRRYTGKNRVGYIGHSQGTTQFFAAQSENYGDIKDKLAVGILFAPVARCLKIKNQMMRKLVDIHLDAFVNLFGWQSFPPLNMSALEVMRKIKVKCDAPEKSLCENIMYDIGGATSNDINSTQLKNDLGFDPAGSSIHNMKHWMQEMRFDGFRMYNYGLKNYEYYGTLSPPEYKLDNVKTKMLIYSGSRDELADPEDADWVLGKLPESEKVVHKVLNYAHDDFLWALDARNILYPEVVDALKHYVH